MDGVYLVEKMLMPVIPSWVHGDWQAGFDKESMNSKQRIKNDKNVAITEEVLNKAIQKFQKAGGIIRKLPDQKTGSNRMVGKKWANTEMGGDYTA